MLEFYTPAFFGVVAVLLVSWRLSRKESLVMLSIFSLLWMVLMLAVQGLDLLALPSGDSKARAIAAEAKAHPGETVVPAVSPAMFLALQDGRGAGNRLDLASYAAPGIAFPLTGIPNARTVYCQEDEGWAIYKADRFGLRNDDNVWDTGAATVLIGDSFVNGACVADPLADLMTERGMGPVAALGLGGNGPLTGLALMREYLLQRPAPQRIFWLIYANDLTRISTSGLEIDLVRELSTPELVRYLTEDDYSQNYFAEGGREPFRKQQIVALAAEAQNRARCLGGFGGPVCQWADLLSGKHVVTHAARLMAAQGGEDTQITWRSLSPDVRETALRIYADGAEQAKSNGAELVFVLLPHRMVTKGLYPPVPLDWLKDGLKRLDVEVMDLSNAKEGCSPEFARNGSHFSQDGYRLLAEILTGRIDCSRSLP